MGNPTMTPGKCVMSPFSPGEETVGMKEADRFFLARPWMKPGLCLAIGNEYFRRMAPVNGAKADGFRRWAYMIAQARGKSGNKNL